MYLGRSQGNPVRENCPSDRKTRNQISPMAGGFPISTCIFEGVSSLQVSFSCLCLCLCLFFLCFCVVVIFCLCGHSLSIFLCENKFSTFSFSPVLYSSVFHSVCLSLRLLLLLFPVSFSFLSLCLTLFLSLSLTPLTHIPSVFLSVCVSLSVTMYLLFLSVSVCFFVFHLSESVFLQMSLWLFL